MKSFLHGRQVQKGEPLRPFVSNASPGLGKAKCNGQDGEEGPSVECVKEGGKVVRLIVTCSCGERIEVECLYPPGT